MKLNEKQITAEYINRKFYKERKELNSLNDSKNNTKNQELLELRQKNNELLSKILNKKD